MCELLIIELNLSDDEDDELTELYCLQLEEKLNKLLLLEKPNRKHCILAAFGPNDRLAPILNKTSQEFSIQKDQILLFGKSPYKREEIETVYSLVSVKVGEISFECISLPESQREKRTIGMLPAYCISHILWNEMAHIANASIEGDPINVQAALSKASRVFLGASSKLISASLDKAIEPIRKLVDLEIAFFCGQETRSIGNFLWDSSLKDISSNPLFNLVTDYSQSELSKLGLPDLEARIEFIQTGITLRSSLNQSLSATQMPRLFLWFSSYFLRLALIFSSRIQYSASAALTMRALEVYCQGLLIGDETGFFDHKGDFLINGKRAQGIGALWGSALNVSGFCPDESTKNEIWHAIELRNKSIFGHGVMHPNKAMFEQIFSSVKKVIKSYEDKHVPSPKLWDPLMAKVHANVFRGIDKTIASRALILLQLYPV